MTSPPASVPTRNRASAVLATLALVSITGFSAVLVALHLLRPDVPPLAMGVSHYANGAAGGIFRVATAALGLGGLALMLGLALGLAPAARSVTGLALLGLWGVAQFVTACFPIDAPGAPATTAGTIHGLAGLSFLAAVASALLLTRACQRDPRWLAIAGPMRVLALTLLVAAVALYVLIEPLAGLGVGGLAQRIYWVALLAWLACTALWLRSTSAAPERSHPDAPPALA